MLNEREEEEESSTLTLEGPEEVGSSLEVGSTGDDLVDETGEEKKKG